MRRTKFRAKQEVQPQISVVFNSGYMTDVGDLAKVTEGAHWV
jgi:hypothetical protein